MSAATTDIKFVSGQTFHSRHGVIKNAFQYKLDSLLIPVNAMGKANSRLFSRNKFNLFSFYDGDHGDGENLHDFAEKIVDFQNFNAHFSGEILLLTQPRFLGYVFNPVSFWFFLDQEKCLRAVVAEVNNTVSGAIFIYADTMTFRPSNPKTKSRLKNCFMSPLFKTSPAHMISNFDLKKTVLALGLILKMAIKVFMRLNAVQLKI